MLFIVLAVHEDEVVAIPVEIGGVAAIHGRGFHFHAGVVGLVDDLAGEHVLELGAHEGRTLAGLDMLELDDGPELAVDIEYEAILEVGCGCHGRSFSFSLLQAPTVRSA